MPKRKRRTSKKKGPSKPKNKSNPQDMLAQMQQMQADMAAAQTKLESELITVTAGGGAISITISGHQRVQAIEIVPDLLNPEEAEMLQDMLVAAVNSAIEQSQAMAAEKMEGITGGLGDSGLDSMLGNLGMG